MTLPVRISGHDAEADLGRLSIVYDLHRISLIEGLRAACAVSAMLLLGHYLRIEGLGIAAFAALLACSADPGGRKVRRMPWMLGFAAVGAILTLGGGLLGELPLWLVVPAACAVVFVLGFLRVYGQAALVSGNMLSTVFIIALDRRESLAEALTSGGYFLAGALWAALLVLVLWPIQPTAPARDAVAGVYRGLAALVADLRDLVGRDCRDDAAWEAHARAYRRSVRTAIEAARAALHDTALSRGSITDRGPTAVIRLEAGDQLFGALIALSDLLEADHDAHTRATAHRLLRVLRPLCVVLAQAAEHDVALRVQRVERGIATIAACAEALPAECGAVARAIVERLHVAAKMAAPELPGAADRLARPPWRDSVAGPVQANLRWRSPALRHAARVAAVALPAFAVTLHWPTTYGHWLTITLLLTLQPFMSLIWQRALERIGGTLLGCVIAAALSALVPGGLGMVLAVVPMTLACFALRPAGFGLMMTFMTPLVVLLSELARPGESGLEIAAMRALCTLGGGALAVAGGMFLWPSREPARLRQALRAALLAHAAYAEAEFAQLSGDAAAPVEAARRAAGRASNEIETSLSRALLEPGRSAQKLQVMMLADAALRRLAGRLAALQLAGPVALAEEWRRWVVAALREMAEQRHAPPRPVGAMPEKLARIVRQILIMDGTIP